MSELMDKWLAYYDPIHRGWTPRGIANGVCATRGFAFPRVAGGYNLYRSQADSEDIDCTSPVGSSGAKSSQIQSFDWRPHEPSSAYVYAVRSIGGGGVESDESRLSLPVAFDESGQPDSLRPNAVRGPSASVLSGGRIEVSWAYSNKDEEASPDHFDVFDDAGTGTVAYVTPIGSVAYRLRAHRFVFVAGPFDHGSRRRFGVRAVASSGATDESQVTVEAVADAEGPPSHPAILVETVEAD